MVPRRNLVNSKTGTLVFSGNVELSATTISHNGLTITVTNTPVAGRPPTAHRARAASLKDLMDAFNLLKVMRQRSHYHRQATLLLRALHCQMEGE